MSEQDMIEKCAKAIYLARNGTGVLPWSRREAAHKEPYLKDARAVIEALMTPDDAMLEAMFRADTEVSIGLIDAHLMRDSVPGVRPTTIRLGYEEMFTAALRTILSQPTKDRV